MKWTMRCKSSRKPLNSLSKKKMTWMKRYFIWMNSWRVSGKNFKNKSNWLRNWLIRLREMKSLRLRSPSNKLNIDLWMINVTLMEKCLSWMSQKAKSMTLQLGTLLNKIKGWLKAESNEERKERTKNVINRNYSKSKVVITTKRIVANQNRNRSRSKNQMSQILTI